MMDSIVNFPLFVISGIILNLTPGQDTFYIISRTLGNGTRAGIVSALGISTGAMVHTLLTALGVSAVLSGYPGAIKTLQFCGGLYLLYLGITTLKSIWGEVKTSPPESNSKLKAIYRQGFITNLLNPKIFLFFLTFLPQFVKPAAADSPLPYLFLGGTFITTGTIWCFFLAAISGITGRFIFQKSGTGRITAIVSAITLFSLGTIVLVSLL